MWYHGSESYLREKELAQPSWGSPPAIFWTLALSMSSRTTLECWYRTREEALVCPLFNIRKKEFTSFTEIYSSMQTEFYLLFVAMGKAGWILKFGEGVTLLILKLILVNGEPQPIQGSLVHFSCSLGPSLCPWLVGSQ